MDKALFCADPLTGLITAGALVRPEKKLAFVEAKSIRKRFKEKSFAAGATVSRLLNAVKSGWNWTTSLRSDWKRCRGQRRVWDCK